MNCVGFGQNGEAFGVRGLYRRIESIKKYIRELEGELSVHDAVMECAGSDFERLSEILEAISYSREALSALARINEVMESVGGEVASLKWEISKMRRVQTA
jgi:hypothetical protein